VAEPPYTESVYNLRAPPVVDPAMLSRESAEPPRERLHRVQLWHEALDRSACEFGALLVDFEVVREPIKSQDFTKLPCRGLRTEVEEEVDFVWLRQIRTFTTKGVDNLCIPILVAHSLRREQISHNPESSRLMIGNISSKLTFGIVFGVSGLRPN